MDFAQLIESFSIHKKPHSELEITGEIPFERIERYRDEALAHIAEHLEMPGFRKGHVPQDIALKKAGEAAVLEEAVELFMRDFYPELVLTKKLDVVGRPYIRITKLAAGNPVGLTIQTAVYPEIKMPENWKSLAQNVAPAEVKEAADEEVAQTLESLRMNRKVTHEAELVTGEKPADTLPAMNDDFARSLGAFKDLEDLKSQVKKGITEEKARAARDARRGKIIDALLEKTDIDLPNIFVESELEKILAQLREDVSRLNVPFEDYLKKINKTEEEVRNEFREQAARRAKLQLLLNTIAEREKVLPDTAAVEEEMKHALQHFPDADPERVRVHIETVLRNKQVFKLLEAEEMKEA